MVWHALRDHACRRAAVFAQEGLAVVRKDSTRGDVVPVAKAFVAQLFSQIYDVYQWKRINNNKNEAKNRRSLKEHRWIEKKNV